MRLSHTLGGREEGGQHLGVSHKQIMYVIAVWVGDDFISYVTV